MAETMVKRFQNGQFVDAVLPDWEDGETQEQFFARLGYHRLPTKMLGHDGFEPVLSIYSPQKPTDDTLVALALEDAYCLVLVQESLDLILLCNQFAPLAQLALMQAYLDLWTGREDDRPGLEEVMRKR